MAYVARDIHGKIIGVSKKANPKMPEYLPDDSPELQEALIAARPQLLKKELDKLNTELGRLGEDILDILIRKNIILFTDLPENAQDLIYARNQIYMEWLDAVKNADNLEQGLADNDISASSSAS